MFAAEDANVSSDHGLHDLDTAAVEYARRRDAAPAGERSRLRDDLIRGCLPFAGRLARRYWGRGEPVEDLEQVARLGLVKAVDRYDPERGSFTAYAVVTISGEIKRHFRDRTWGVHVPRRLQDLSLEVGYATVVLTNILARTPTVAELAAHLRIDEHVVTDALESAAGYSPASLNAPVGGETAREFGDLFGCADQDLESVEDRVTVADLLLRLPARERRMLAMRFYGNRTQTEIAAEFGISQMHVSRLLSRALGWLRDAMLSDALPPWEGAGAGMENHELRVTVGRSDGETTVRVFGEVDRDTACRLRRQLRAAVAGAGRSQVVVDLGAVPLIDAAGVAALVDGAAAARTAEVGFHLSRAQPYVARVLALAGLCTLLS
jgi:RNA polymerase sigma-B factor